MIRSHPEDAPRWRGTTLNAVLFDLDGTLVDSAADVASALNRTFEEFRLGTFEVNSVRQMIGGGAYVLVERALRHLGHDAGGVRRDVLVARFISNYECLVRYDSCETRVFEGVCDGLRKLHAMGLRLAVVTNKHRSIAIRLLQQLRLASWLDIVIGRDDCERGKPDPQPLRVACGALDVAPTSALMVGDSLNDVNAARAAGMPVVCVPYGFTEGTPPRSLPCDAYIESIADLPALLRGSAPTAAAHSNSHPARTTIA